MLEVDISLNSSLYDLRACDEPVGRVAVQVGELNFPKAEMDSTFNKARVIFDTPWKFTADLKRYLNPDIVISQLYTEKFDCIELAEQLIKLDYDNTLFLVSSVISDPEIILDEIRQLAPPFSLSFLFRSVSHKNRSSETISLQYL